MSGQSINHSDLVHLLNEHCVNWVRKAGSKERIAALSTGASAALRRLLLAEMARTPTFEVRAQKIGDLAHFDFSLNALAAELLLEIHGVASFDGDDQIEIPRFFKGAPNRNEVNGLVNVLNKKGYCPSPVPLTQQQIFDVFEVLGQCQYSTKGHYPHTMTGIALLDALKNGSMPPVSDGDTYWLTDQDELVHNPLLASLAFDPYIISVVSKYLGCAPVHVQTNAWFSLPSAQFKSNLSSNAQMFHQDKEFVKFLKVFVYLTDVGMEQGPHSYIEGSHLDELHRKGPGLSDRVADADIGKYYEPSRLKTVTGPAGMVLFGDTSCVHKGEPVRAGYRVMLQLEYASSLYLSPVKPFNDMSESQLSLMPYGEAVAKCMTRNYSSDQRMAFERFEKLSGHVGLIGTMKSALRGIKSRISRKLA